MQDETTYILEPTAFHSMTEPRFSPTSWSRTSQSSATSLPTSSPRSSRCSPRW